MLFDDPVLSCFVPSCARKALNPHLLSVTSDRHRPGILCAKNFHIRFFQPVDEFFSRMSVRIVFPSGNERHVRMILFEKLIRRSTIGAGGGRKEKCEGADAGMV